MKKLLVKTKKSAESNMLMKIGHKENDNKEKSHFSMKQEKMVSLCISWF